MRYCKIENNKVTNVIKADQSFIDSLTDTYVQDDLAQVGFELVNGILTDTTPLPTPPTLDENKQSKIKALQDKYQADYDVYLSQYPQSEIATFNDKKNEALAYNLDNTTPTPIIDSIVTGYGTAITKLDYINSVLAKITYLAKTEGQMVAIRDSIKAVTTQAELDAIVI
jgi:hypothetical protein